MAAIKIVRAPDGEAPLYIRQAWVGCVLPLPDTSDNQPQCMIGEGVITGEGSRWITNIVAPTLEIVGYPVYVLEALEVLEAHNPIAAEWWREYTPHLLAPEEQFIFDAASCEEVPYG